MSTPLNPPPTGSPASPITEAKTPSATPVPPVPIWLIVSLGFLLIAFAIFFSGTKIKIESPSPASSEPSSRRVPDPAPSAPPLLYGERELEQLRRLDSIGRDADRQLEKNK